MLIVALDPPINVGSEKWVTERYKVLRDIVKGFKIGLPAIVKYGINWLNNLFKDYDGLSIADLKLADIGDIMALTATMLRNVGFNAVIAHAFVGYEKGIEVLAKVCEKEGIKLILVVSMSHEGSKEFIDRHIDEFVDTAERVGSWGVVAPATRPNVIQYIRSKVGSKIKIISPGVGVQGAEPGAALCAGADYEIVGRAITYSDLEKVRELAHGLLESQKKRLLLCRG
ncbi:MAG: orotidine 5'-phosphate decarboxylase / HUMPS family protein [Ignisphaera sp.]